MNLANLAQIIQAIVPVVSISIGDINDKNSWIIQYVSEPSAEIIAQVQAVLAAYTPLTSEQIASNMQNQAILDASNSSVVLYLEQLAGNIATTLTQQQFQALITQRQAARAAIIQES